MRTIAKLFSRSPFVPLQTHMDKVAACVEKVVAQFEAFFGQDHEAVASLADEVSRLEHEADEAKYNIQNQLPKGILMPVARDQFLEILAIQDSLADKAENIAVLLTLKKQTVPETFRHSFKEFLAKNVEAFAAVRRIVQELDELLETGFGGAEAENVRKMVLHVARLEHEADRIQQRLLKALFAQEQEMSVGSFLLWDKIFRQVSALSNTSERLAHRIRRTLDLK